jgi:hypothetical protein
VPTIITRMRMLFIGLALLLFAPGAMANAGSTTRAETPVTDKQVAAGSPEMGVLIIIGVVAFLFFVAWIVSRMGDDSRSGDTSLV